MDLEQWGWFSFFGWTIPFKINNAICLMKNTIFSLSMRLLSRVRHTFLIFQKWNTWQPSSALRLFHCSVNLVHVTEGNCARSCYHGNIVPREVDNSMQWFEVVTTCMAQLIAVILGHFCLLDVKWISNAHLGFHFNVVFLLQNTVLVHIWVIAFDNPVLLTANCCFYANALCFSSH